MTGPETSISIVIPAHNEATVIDSTIREIASFVGSRFARAEVIVVNDGSSDDTVSVVMAVRDSYSGPVDIRLLDQGRQRGKGHAVRSGVLQARNEHILMTDADLSTPISDVDALLERIRTGADIAIASRTAAGARVTLPQPVFRRVLGRIYNALVKAVAVRGYGDTQCGFKLFRADAARDLFSRCVIDGFAFDVEMLYLAGKSGYRVDEVPVTWMNRSPDSKVRLRSDYAAMLIDLVRIRHLH
jgi:dolichyl-phosphate beta-glucosyltransferase